MPFNAHDSALADTWLEQTDSLLGQSATWLKHQASPDGSLDQQLLDQHQVALFDLACCKAELEGAKHLLAWAVAALAAGAAPDGIEQGMARLKLAQALLEVRNRLAARPPSFGINAGQDMMFLFTGPISQFIADTLDGANLTRLGLALVAAGGDTGMDLLDAEKRMMRRSFRQFAEHQVQPQAAEIHREDLIIPDNIIEGLRELGCFGLSVPERFGGLNPDDGDDSLGMMVVTEELSRGSLGAAGSLITRPEIMARALLEGGTPEQQAHWLPQIAAGDPLVAISVTEPDTGSDVANVQLRASRCDGGWRLQGNKAWCTFAGKAGLMLVLARTDPEAQPAHRGLSLFLVEKPVSNGHEFNHVDGQGGHVSGRAVATVGYRGMHSFEVHYDNFFVPDSHVVGGEQGLGRGFYYTMRGFAGGRVQTAARATGVMQACYEAALTYAQERKVFGQAVADFPLTLAKLAQMATAIATARQGGYAVARMMDRGAGQMEASLIKLSACKMAEWVAREAMQIHGGMGYAEETAVSRLWQDARVLSIFEGAEETLALRVVGRQLVAQA